MGYGFVQFLTKKATVTALKELQNSTLEGHEIELKVNSLRFCVCTECLLIINIVYSVRIEQKTKMKPWLLLERHPRKIKNRYPANCLFEIFPSKPRLKKLQNFSSNHFTKHVWTFIHLCLSTVPFQAIWWIEGSPIAEEEYRKRITSWFCVHRFYHQTRC